MKSNKTFFYDFETLGKDPRVSPVLCCAGVEVDLSEMHDREFTFDELCEKSKVINFDVQEQINHRARKIDKSTLTWWENTVKPEVRKKIFDQSNAFSVSNFAEWLEGFEGVNYNKIKTFFSRGQGFDSDIAMILLEESKVDATKYIPWWACRDTRSFIEGMSYSSGLRNGFIPTNNYCGIPDDPDLHDPIVDIVIDVLRIQFLIRNLYI